MKRAARATPRPASASTSPPTAATTGHWCPGSPAVSSNRSIGAISVDPAQRAAHLHRHRRCSPRRLVGQRRPHDAAERAEGWRSTSRPTAARPSTRSLSRPADTVDPASPNGSDFFRGGVTDVAVRPDAREHALRDGDRLRALPLVEQRHAPGRRSSPASPIPRASGIRYEFAPATLANGKTRIYLGEGLNEFTDPVTDNPNPDSASRLLRTDDATGAAAFTQPVELRPELAGLRLVRLLPGAVLATTCSSPHRPATRTRSGSAARCSTASSASMPAPTCRTAARSCVRPTVASTGTT